MNTYADLPAKPLALNIDGQTIAGLHYRPTATPSKRILCVHGWLDNANSFVPMQPYFQDAELVAIDLPGHGYSAALEGGYHSPDLYYRLYGVIRALGWTDCHVIGHSLGACLIPMLAVACPETINSLTLIDAAGPLAEPAERYAQRIQQAMQDRLNAKQYQSRRFDNHEQAIAARLRAALMQPDSARLIIERQLQAAEGGFTWRFDPRWRHASAHYHTEEQVHAVLSAVTCPVLTIVASDGFLMSRRTTDARLSCITDNEIVRLQGHHHLHMDTPKPVADAIHAFFNRQSVYPSV